MMSGSWLWWPNRHRRAWVLANWVLVAINGTFFVWGLVQGERWWFSGFATVMAYAANVYAKRMPDPPTAPPATRRIGLTMSGPSVIPGARIRCLDCYDEMGFEPGLSRCRCGAVFISVEPESTVVSVHEGATGFERVLPDDQS
jgi:hypothetical protein